MSNPKVIRQDLIVTGDLILGGEILNAALTATIQAAFPLYDAMIYQGVIASLATFPAANKGDLYKITAAGSIGGTGPTVAVGDIVICNTDSTGAGDYATVGTKWDIIPATNIDSLDDLISGTAESDFITSNSTPFGWAKRTLAATKTILGLAGIVPAGTAEDDFIVAGSTPFTWAKQTLAQVKSTLGLGSAAYTSAADYTAAVMSAIGDIIYGGVAGVATRLGANITTTKKFVTSTGTGSAGQDPSWDTIISADIATALTTPGPIGNTPNTGIFDPLLLTEKTPVNAVAAEGVLTVSGVPDHRDTCTIGIDVYTFQDAIGAGSKATEDLTFTGNAANNEVVVIGTGGNARTYEFADAIAPGGAAAEGVMTWTGLPIENEIVTLGAGGAEKVYRWRDQIAAIAASKVLTWAAVGANGETVTIDTTIYEWVTALTEAKATSTLTISTNPSDGNSVTINATTYTFKEEATSAYDVHIGALAGDTADNLRYAINDSGGSEGTDYGSGTDVNPDVVATDPGGDAVLITANAIGVAHNAYVTTELTDDCAWTGGTMSGGLDAVANEVLVEAGVEDEVDNLVAACTEGAGEGTKYSTGQVAHTTVTVTKDSASTILATATTAGTAGNSIAIAEACAQLSWAAGATFLSGGYALAVANDVIIGGSAELSIDNLVLAVNDSSGEGTNYGAGTVVHTTIAGSKTAADEFTATARSNGDAGNSEVCTTDVGNASWAAATLLGGEEPDTAWMVLIGADAEGSIDNLVLAVTYDAGAGTNEGVKYGTGTTQHPDTTAAKQAADIFRATAKSVGDAGNLIASTTDLGAATWGAALLSGGDDADAAFDVLIGVSEDATIDNFVAAINLSGGAGTTYGTDTTAQGDVTGVNTGGDVMTITAVVSGVAGNAIAKAEDNGNMDWDGVGAVLTGGIDGTVGVANETCGDASYLYHAIAANTIADDNWRRVALGSAY